MRKEIAMISFTKGEDRKDGMLFKKELIGIKQLLRPESNCSKKIIVPGKNHIGFNRFLGYSKWRPNSKKIRIKKYYNQVRFLFNCDVNDGDMGG